MINFYIISINANDVWIIITVNDEYLMFVNLLNDVSDVETAICIVFLIYSKQFLNIYSESVWIQKIDRQNHS